MEEARNITHADGHTLYMKADDGKTMDFEILRTDSTNTVMGGTSGTKITFPPVQLYNDKGMANMNHINTYVAHTGKTLNIEDAYKEDGFDFSGTKNVDKNNVLCEPTMRNTAPCIAYAAFKIYSKNEDANMIVAPSDHLITNEDEFVKVVNDGMRMTAK